jgi:hypothetical protein
MAQRKTVKKAEMSANMRGIALGAMIVGIIGVALCWYPGWGFVISAAGLTLGIIALVRRAPNHGMALAGTILGGVGILLNIIFIIGFIILITLAPSASDSGTPQPQPYPYYN